MGQDIIIDADTPWLLGPEPCEPLQRTLRDVSLDWHKVFGRPPIIMRSIPDSWKGSVIRFGMETDDGGTLDATIPVGKEGYILRVDCDDHGRNMIHAVGKEMRGSIYAAYAFSEEILGVDPWYFWVDREPTPKQKIKISRDFDKSSGPPTFKYRGWFINDEDQFAGFLPDPLRKNVFSLELMDRIYETILRLRGNMVVPASFPFPDESCHKLAAKRGLILSTHHILVLGLNTYRWPKGTPFSYRKHPEIMENYWQECIHAFKDYEMVWSVGYRGLHDRPFWVDEPEISTPQEQGRIISEAVARQVELIQRVQPGAPMVSNLWAEGAELYQRGFTQFPKEVILAWPDNGAWGIIQDKGLVQPGQGIYYHTSNWFKFEMARPEIIFREFGRFVDAGATEFSLVNVSGIRPYPISTDCIMKFLWNAKAFSEKSCKDKHNLSIANWSEHQFGQKMGRRVADLYRRYYQIPYLLHAQPRLDWMGEANRLMDRIQPLLLDEKLIPKDIVVKCHSHLNFCKRHESHLASLGQAAKRLLLNLPPKRRAFFHGHLVLQVQTHWKSLLILSHFCKAMLSLEANKVPQVIHHLEMALQANQDLNLEFQKSEYGKWKGWNYGERFLSLMTLTPQHDRLRSTLALIKKNPPPLVRIPSNVNSIWEEIQQYQNSFTGNFPLLTHPASS